MAELGFIQAINQAIEEEMRRDPSVVVLGEDVRAIGAPLGEFKGLYDKFGADRVIDTPISETAIMGAAIGAAVTGLHPIANIMYANFLGVCGDELVNQLTQMRYMFGGEIKVPVTIMSYAGAGTRHAAQHSRNFYGWLMNITGLKIIAPSTPYDAKGLLKTALRDNNPTIFLYHTALIKRGVKSEVPADEYTIPLGKADIKREGKDLTVVAMALTVHEALAAAETLQKQGISIEVVDPRTLVPLDKETILNSVKKTGRLVIFDEEPKTGSAAAEIAAVMADEAFDYMDAPIKRVCAPDTPVPYSPVLEDFWLPDRKDLIEAVTQLV